MPGRTGRPSGAFARLVCGARNERSRRSQGERGARANPSAAFARLICGARNEREQDVARYEAAARANPSAAFAGLVCGARNEREQDVARYETAARAEWKATLRKLGFLLVALLLLSNCGCLFLALGAAGGAAAAGYAYYKGEVIRDYPSGLLETHRATRATLADMGFRLDNEETHKATVHLVTHTTQDTPVHIWLREVPSVIPAQGVLTQVSVRVGTFGDESASKSILEEIDRRLPSPLPGQPSPSAARLRPVAHTAPTAPPARGRSRAPVRSETPPPPLATHPSPSGRQ